MRIAVVIPAFNEANYISKCLDALTRQSRTPDHIFVIDNNSTDATVDIASSYAHVTIIPETQQGICAATKTGLDAAAREYDLILRCDADCMPPVDWAERIERHFTQHPESMSVTGPGIAYDVGPIARRLIDWFYMKPYFAFTSLALGYRPLFGSNFALRASQWRAISNKTHLTSKQTLHDDMDISFHLSAPPKYDSTLVMPISARPFKKPWKLPARYSAGFRSVFLHWPEQAPWKRRHL